MYTLAARAHSEWFGTDVGGGPLAPDVLLAGGERRQLTPPPCGIVRAADQAAWKAARQVLTAGGAQADVRTASGSDSGRLLPSPAAMSRSVFARRRDHGPADRVDARDRQGTSPGGRFR
jgi:hypothetical protein